MGIIMMCGRRDQADGLVVYLPDDIAAGCEVAVEHWTMVSRDLVKPSLQEHSLARPASVRISTKPMAKSLLMILTKYGGIHR